MSQTINELFDRDPREAFDNDFEDEDYDPYSEDNTEMRLDHEDEMDRVYTRGRAEEDRDLMDVDDLESLHIDESGYFEERE